MNPFSISRQAFRSRHLILLLCVPGLSACIGQAQVPQTSATSQSVLTPTMTRLNSAVLKAEDAVLGAAYTPRATEFRVFAPTAQSVGLILYDEPTGTAGRSVSPLKSQTAGLWDLRVEGNLAGRYYTYLIAMPGLSAPREVLDPYAVNAVLNSTRGRITAMPQASRFGPPVQSPTDMVIYEMHVRDFTISPTSGVQHNGRYLGFIEQGTSLPGDAKIRTALDHLVELGVTHVQLMPVQDFQNDETNPRYDWGYIPTAFFSPEGMFATNPADDSRVREFKALVDAVHARGLGVIMDVVYNHTAMNASLQICAPRYYYRYLPDGSLANGSACGNEVRSEAPMARKLIVDSLKFWVREYGIDGFRFDLMALIDRETMREAGRELRAINPGIVLYGEPWTGGPTPLKEKTDKSALRELPVGCFNDNYRNSLKGSTDGNEPGFIQNGSRRAALQKAMLLSDWYESPGQSINYMTCHDNLVLWDKLRSSMPGAGEEQFKRAMKLGYLALLTSQGVPFMHGGEEFARSKGGNKNSYNAPDSVNQVDWSLKQKNFDLFSFVRDAIALRQAHPLFRLRTREQVEMRVKFLDTSNERVLIYTIDGDGVPGETWRQVCVILNADSAAAGITLPTGDWSMAMDERGLAEAKPVSGEITVPQKSGLVAYRR